MDAPGVYLSGALLGSEYRCEIKSLDSNRSHVFTFPYLIILDPEILDFDMSTVSTVQILYIETLYAGICPFGSFVDQSMNERLTCKSKCGSTNF